MFPAIFFAHSTNKQKRPGSSLFEGMESIRATGNPPTKWNDDWNTANKKVNELFSGGERRLDLPKIDGKSIRYAMHEFLQFYDKLEDPDNDPESLRRIFASIVDRQARRELWKKGDVGTKLKLLFEEGALNS
jgi:hypothetical protein